MQAVGGTVPYMAPEQLDGKPHPASDQYALAVVIYEWLTGRCPFVGTAVEVVFQHAAQVASFATSTGARLAIRSRRSDSSMR